MENEMMKKLTSREKLISDFEPFDGTNEIVNAERGGKLFMENLASYLQDSCNVEYFDEDGVTYVICDDQESDEFVLTEDDYDDLCES